MRFSGWAAVFTLAICLGAAGEAREADPAQYEAPAPVNLEARETGRWKAEEARQGAAVLGASFYAINNHDIGRYSRKTGGRKAEWAGLSGGPVRHINSCFAEEGLLYCANSNYPETPMAGSVEVFDAATLEHVYSHSLGVRDEGSLVWFDRLGDGWIAGFAHYNSDAGLPYKDSAYSAVHLFDAQWRRTGGWMLPSALVERLSPYAASGGALGQDGFLYLMGHDRPEMYVLARPAMGPKLVHIATIAIAAEGQAFAFDPGAPRTVFAVSRPNREVRAFELPDIPAAALTGETIRRFGE